MTTVTARHPACQVMLPDEELWRAARSLASSHRPRRKVGVRHCWPDVITSPGRELYVVAWRGTLLEEAQIREAQKRSKHITTRFLLLPDRSAPEDVPELVCRLKVRSVDRIHTPTLKVDDADTFVRRFLAALAKWPTGQTIADAWWEKDNFVVFSPTFARLKVPVGSLPKMAAASRRDLERFEIDDYGEYIYWPSHDVHMGWPQFEQAVNPHARLRARQASKDFNRRYGQAVRHLRREAGLRQSDITGLDERTVRRIEQGRTRATANAIGKLARAHGLESGEYLAKLADTLGNEGTLTGS